MEKYKLRSDVTLQRGFRIPEGITVMQYLKLRSYYPDMLSSNFVMVASIESEKVSYGFNVVAAIFIEALLNGQSEDDVISGVSALFKQSEDKIRNDYHNVFTSLVEKRIIQREDE